MANKRIKDLSTTAAVTASDDFIAVDGATNGTRKLDAYSPTFGGNLTVSGTGTSTFSGDIKIQKANAQLEIRSASDAAGQFQYLTFGSPNYNRAQFRSNNQGVADGAISLYTFDAGIPVVAQYWTKSGNSLLGAVIDGGNGKLQLATHSTSAGGIGFGTDTSLYRSAAGILNLAQPAGINSEIWFETNSSNKGKIVVTNSGTMALVSNGTTAITLDSSQNATFANGLVVGKPGSVNFITGGDGGGGTYIIQFKDGLGAAKVNITGDGKTILLNTTASTSTTTGALQVSGGVGVAGAVNIGGSIAIGNTVQTAAAVASTHKVTVVIGGVTYYLLATNI